MPTDRGLQIERSRLAQRRTAMLVIVLMVASLKVVCSHPLERWGMWLVFSNLVAAGVGSAGLLWGEETAAAASLKRIGQRFAGANLIMCACAMQIATNVISG